MLQIAQIPALTDNYVFLLRDSATGITAVVDPAVSGPVLAAMDQLGWGRIDYILNTHHHSDHIGGNPDLIAATGCRVVGNRDDAERITGIAVPVEPGQSFMLGTSEARVLDVPGHTLGHIAYHFAEDKALFCGDTLFALGCGRLFEGTPEQMWRSLRKISALPPDTRIYCAHEYTLANARFALAQEPGNQNLTERARAVEHQRSSGEPTVPSLLAEELATNPFLRTESAEIRTRLGMTHASSVAVFSELRSRKNSYS